MSKPQPKKLPDGPWTVLLDHAYKLIDDFEKHGGLANPFWTLGGGTVLMLRYEHRQSKDIDIFVPDPQYLGYVTPRLSDAAADISHDYVEAAGYVKLIRREGEIDFLAAPNLTKNPFEIWTLRGRAVRVETAAEIIAKKLWHRGDMATARDLFDLALVIEKDPDELRLAAQFLIRHREEFIAQITQRKALFQIQFEAIDKLKYQPEFEDAFSSAKDFLLSL